MLPCQFQVILILPSKIKAFSNCPYTTYSFNDFKMLLNEKFMFQQDNSTLDQQYTAPQ